MLSLAKHSAIDALAATGWWSRRTRPERCHQGRLLIVTFHRVLPDSERARYPYPGLAVTPAELSFCLSYFARHYEVDSISRQHARLRAREQGEKPLLAITFDDGQWDNLAYAEPVLRAHALRATFYVPTRPVQEGRLIWHDELGYAMQGALQRRHGQAAFRALFAQHGLALDLPSVAHAVEIAKQLSPDARRKLVDEAVRIASASPPSWGRLMDWSEVRMLSDRGHEIGSHSVTHELMPQLDDAGLALETEASKRIIEREIGDEVRSYCYPNGSFDARCEQAVARAGYQNAVTTRWGANSRADSAFGLRRCDMDARALRGHHQQLSAARLAFRLSGHYPGLGG